MWMCLTYLQSIYIKKYDLKLNLQLKSIMRKVKMLTIWQKKYKFKALID